MSNLRLRLRGGGQVPAPPPPGRYVNTGGSDAAAGSIEAPWKYIPSDPAAGATVAAYVPSPGETINLARGQRHRPASYTDRDTSHIQLKASGTSGSPIVYQAYGSGSNPKLSGDEPIASWSAATSADVDDNPFWANIQKSSVSNVTDLCQGIYEGDDYLVPAQWPTPNDPYSYNRCTPGLSGNLVVAVADYATKVHQGADGSGGTGLAACWVISDTGSNNLKDHYADGGAPIPGSARIVCFMAGARYQEFDITSYDVATGTVYFNIANNLDLHVSGSTSGLFRFAIRYNPFDIRKVGQYGWGPDEAGTRAVFGAFRTSDERSFARSIPYAIRLTRDYISFKDVDVERFGGNAGQAVFQFANEGGRRDLTIEGMTVRQSLNQNGNYLLYLNNSTSGIQNVTITDLVVEECHNTGGIGLVFASNCTVDGYTQRIEGRTPVYFGGNSHDCVFRNFNLSDWDSAHSNGPSLYQDVYNITVEYGYCMARPRGLSTQTTLAAPTPRNNVIRGLVSTTRKLLPGAFSEARQSWEGATGERGTLVEGCIFGISPAALHPSAGGAASTGMIIRNCVISSLVCAELPGISFENCLIFRESGGGISDVVAKGATDLGGVVYDTGGSWDGVITVAMQQALTRNVGGVGYTARQLGPDFLPWHVPAYGEAFELSDCALTTTKFRANMDAEDVLASVVATQPGSTISLPTGLGDNDLFGLWKGQIYPLSPIAASTRYIHILQTNTHPDLTGPTTKTTIIQITFT